MNDGEAIARRNKEKVAGVVDKHGGVGESSGGRKASCWGKNLRKSMSQGVCMREYWVMGIANSASPFIRKATRWVGVDTPKA